MKKHQTDNTDHEEFITFTGICECSEDHRRLKQFGIFDFDMDTAMFCIEAGYITPGLKVLTEEDLDHGISAIHGKLAITPPDTSNAIAEYGCKFLLVSATQFISDVYILKDEISSDPGVQQFWVCAHKMFEEETRNPDIAIMALKLAELMGVDIPPVLLVYDTYGIRGGAYLTDLKRILDAWTNQPLASFALSLECLDYSGSESPDQRKNQYRELERSVQNTGYTCTRVTDGGISHRCAMSYIPLYSFIDYWKMDQYLTKLSRSVTGKPEEPEYAAEA